MYEHKFKSFGKKPKTKNFVFHEKCDFVYADFDAEHIGLEQLFTASKTFYGIEQFQLKGSVERN